MPGGIPQDAADTWLPSLPHPAHELKNSFVLPTIHGRAMAERVMERRDTKSLESWVALLSHAEIPVLKQTIRELTALREDAENISSRAVAEIIANDPMMTVKVLRYLQHAKRHSQKHEVVEVEQALLMMGVEPFLRNVPPEPPLDVVLRGHEEALVCLLHVVRRSRRASSYAFDWALQLRDLRFAEVQTAALLQNLAEILMWCFATDEMLRVQTLQQQNKALRSRDAQEQVLGFALDDLQLALAREWSLPGLLLNLMDGRCATQARVRNVVLAGNLARHSDNGWDDAALPDDYKEIGELLGVKPEDVMMAIGEQEGRVCDISRLHR
jgi:HD-like signal output (HDOD) protein